MNEIDLFPDELRKKLLFFRWFKLTGYSIALISVVVVGAFLLLNRVNEKIDQEIQLFQTQRKITTANRRQFEQLNQQKENLLQELNLLTGLRSGASAEQMFVMIDRALPGPEVWITSWKFRRAGTPVEDKTETVNTGYFIVIPKGSNNRKEEIWKIETNMKLQGQAMDHVAMSKFVLNLTQQPEIENVRIMNTRLTKVNQVKVVDFSLEIIVATGKGEV